MAGGIPKDTDSKTFIIGEARYKLESTGVGVVDPELGYVVERVYATPSTRPGGSWSWTTAPSS